MDTSAPFASFQLTEDQAQVAVADLCRFIQFETISALGPTNGAYKSCAEWLVLKLRDTFQVAEGKTEEFNVFLLPEAPENSPVVVACWKGCDPTLPVLLLNSHYDVVPALDADWTVPPFQGLVKDGKIYGRGTQDMKCVCIQYIHAIKGLRRLCPEWKPKRSIYLTFVPDEEIGGAGMAAFLDSELYRSLPGIALALDEGLASTDDTFSVFYGERLPWWVHVKATGPTGHGSRFIDNTAVEQLVELVNKALAFRQGQRNLLGMETSHENCTHAVAAARQRKNQLGDVTSLNVTTLQAGVRVGNTFAFNCVPPVAECTLDIRISPHSEPSEIGDMLDQWCQECSRDGADVADPVSRLTWEPVQGHPNFMKHALTSTDPSENIWYGIFSDTMTSTLGYPIQPQVFPAATDSRFLRALGIRALGFSPMRQTEILLHEHDEYIPESTFLEGIKIYFHLIHALGSHEQG